MMKGKYITLLSFLLFISPFTAGLDESKNRDSILAINYLTPSLVKISTYNDRLVLDQEHNNIIT